MRIHKVEFKLREPLAWRFVIIIILLLAFVLRLRNLPVRSLWFDESIEYWVSSAPLRDVHVTLSNATHDPPLYSYILHFWQRLGISEFWLRYLSLFFSIMGVAGVIRLGQSTIGREAGAVTGILIAFSAADIRYAQEAGQYSLMVCALAWNLVFLRLALSKNDWMWWLLWGGSALVSIYSHYGSAIMVAATASVVLARNIFQREWTAVVRQLTIGVASVILLLPLVLIVMPSQLDRLGSTTHQIDLLEFLQKSRAIVLFQLMGNQAGGWPWPNIPAWFAWAPVVVAVIFALIKTKSVLDWPVLLIVSWAIYYLVSCLGIYFFEGSRHSLLLSPLLMVTVASGIVVIRRLHSIPGLAILLSIIVVCFFAPPEGQEDLRTTTHYWLSHHQAGEVTYVYYGAAPGFRYQLVLVNDASTNVPPTWYIDCWSGFSAPYCSENNLFYGRWIRHLSPDLKRESIFRTIGFVPERMWMIFSHIYLSEDEEILAVFADDYRPTLSYQASNSSAYLLEKR